MESAPIEKNSSKSLKIEQLSEGGEPFRYDKERRSTSRKIDTSLQSALQGINYPPPPLQEPAYDILKIESTSPLPVEYGASYLHIIEQILKMLIPKESLARPTEDLGAFFFRLAKLLPIASFTLTPDTSLAIPIAFLCPSEYTPGVGRFIADCLSRWLVPGKQFTIIGRISLNFRFVAHPSTRFYLTQELLAIDNPSDLEIAKKNLPGLIEEMKINIMAVYHARYISSLKSSQLQTKNLIFQEKLSSLLKPTDVLHRSLYDQFQGIFSNSTEEKIDQIKKNLSSLMNARPKTFDRDIFYEIAQYSLLFREQFSSERDSRHLSRVIAYQYLFKKVTQESAKKSPLERHVSLKVFKGPSFKNFSSLSLVITFNFLRESECFEFRHLMEAIRSCLPYLDYVPDSLIADRRDEKIRFFYIELIKKGNSPFSSNEIKYLKEKLPSELIRQIETTVHPIFMPRNEEEILRNLILLSKQIKYVRDLPQVTIHYDMQSESDLSFTVIVVRLLKENSATIQKLLERLSLLKVELDDVRNAGYLKRKYLKEAAILRITLDKAPFFRADQSVDLLRARQKIVRQLTKALGEFRDFNGGIILKQEEALTALRNALSPLSSDQELLLENYFYSLRPGIMQTVYDTSILKDHFLLLKKVLAKELSSKSYVVASTYSGKYFLAFVKAMTGSFKEALTGTVHAMKIPSYDLTTAFFEVDQKAVLGMVLRAESKEKVDLFFTSIEEALKRWESHFLCFLSPPA